MLPDNQRQHLESVRRRIHAAAERAHRSPREVKVIAATKTRTPAQIRALVHADTTGMITGLGENRAQEARHKIGQLDDLDMAWHFIGVLQTNKVKYLAGRFDVVHSVDRVELVEAIARRAPALRVLVQVNVSGEASKSGVAPERAADLCRRVVEAGVGLDGLMTMAPLGDPDEARAAFSGLRELRDSVAQTIGRPLRELSMGMTDDFVIAVEEGATLVRLGRILFGPRRAEGR